MKPKLSNILVCGTIMKRFVVLVIILDVICCSSIFAKEGEFSDSQIAQMRLQRKQAAHNKRRIIYNNDGCDWLDNRVKPPLTVEKFLKRRTTALINSQVDSIFYCTGVFNAYTHKSTVSEQMGYNGLAEEQRVFAKLLNEAGYDTLQAIVDFGHKHNKEVIWSMRMNDTHDSSKDRPWMWTKWKKDNLHLLMAEKYTSFPYGWDPRPSWPWSAVDYEKQQVRDKVLEILTDVCSRYDIDGVELDFFRFPVFFKPQLYGQPVTQQHCDMMTDLVKKVRVMTENVSLKRGRPLLVAVRVPDSFGYAKEMGLDVVNWLDNDLVDIIIGGGTIQLQTWDKLVAAVKKYDVPVYACFEDSMVPYSGLSVQEQCEYWRAAALEAWRAGVDGVYTFNMFNPNHPMLDEIGDPNLLEKLPRKEQFSPSWFIYRHAAKVGIQLKGGEKYFDPNYAKRWLEPVPQIMNPVGFGFEPNAIVLVKDPYKLSLSKSNGAYRLVDIVKDPDEMHDLKKKKAGIYQTMKNELEDWIYKHSQYYELPRQYLKYVSKK